jgi:hypothetical protein
MQTNAMLCWLQVEAGHSAAQYEPALCRKCQHLKFRCGAQMARLVVPRQMAGLYGLLRPSRGTAGEHAR